MTERTAIFTRIREALATPAPIPGHGHEAASHRSSSPLSPPARQWLPLVGENFEERLTLFRKNAADGPSPFDPANPYLSGHLAEQMKHKPRNFQHASSNCATAKAGRRSARTAAT